MSQSHSQEEVPRRFNKKNKTQHNQQVCGNAKMNQNKLPTKLHNHRMSKQSCLQGPFQTSYRFGPEVTWVSALTCDQDWGQSPEY